MRELTYHRTSRKREGIGDGRGLPENAPPDSRIQAFFHQSCSACGRPLRTPVHLLGERVACGHCGHDFVAADPATTGAMRRKPDNLQRASQLLARFDSQQEVKRRRG